MRVKFLTIALITIMLFIIVACYVGVTYFFRSGGEIINEDILTDNLSAKELVKIAKPYVDKYWRNRNYHVGKVSMVLDANLEGKVEIWYKDDTRDNNVPNIITVEIDTKEKKILRIINQERNTKIVPGIINIENWDIDSDQLTDIAKSTFKEYDEFNFTVAYIFGTDYYRNGTEVWDVNLYNDKNKKTYHLKIDAYTGEVYKHDAK